MSRRRTSDTDTHFYEDTMANVIEIGDCIRRAVAYTRDPNVSEQVAAIAHLTLRIKERLQEYRRWQLDGVEPEYLNGHTDKEMIAQQLETLAAKLRYMD